MDFANFSDASVVVIEVATGISPVVVDVVVLIPAIGTAFNGMTAIGTFCSFFFNQILQLDFHLFTLRILLHD